MTEYIGNPAVLFPGAGGVSLPTTDVACRIVPQDVSGLSEGDSISSAFNCGISGMEITPVEESTPTKWYPDYFLHDGDDALDVRNPEFPDIVRPWAYAYAINLTSSDNRDHVTKPGGYNGRIRQSSDDTGGDYELQDEHFLQTIQGGLSYGSWVYVILTSDDIANEIKIYVNGVLAKTFSSISYDLNVNSASYYWRFGGQGTDSDAFGNDGGVRGKTRGFIVVESGTVAEALAAAEEWTSYWATLE